MRSSSDPDQPRRARGCPAPAPTGRALSGDRPGGNEARAGRRRSSRWPQWQPVVEHAGCVVRHVVTRNGIDCWPGMPGSLHNRTGRGESRSPSRVPPGALNTDRPSAAARASAPQIRSIMRSATAAGGRIAVRRPGATSSRRACQPSSVRRPGGHGRRVGAGDVGAGESLPRRAGPLMGLDRHLQPHRGLVVAQPDPAGRGQPGAGAGQLQVPEVLPGVLGAAGVGSHLPAERLQGAGEVAGARGGRFGVPIRRRCHRLRWSAARRPRPGGQSAPGAPPPRRSPTGPARRQAWSTTPLPARPVRRGWR